MAPVHDAAKADDVEALQRLLDADPGLVEAEHEGGRYDYEKGYRPLLLACRAGSAGAARLLLERGARIDRPNPDDGATPLLDACEHGHAEVVALLLARGADPTLRSSGNSKWTALMLACAEPSRYLRARGSGHAAVIRLLLKDGRVAVNAWNYRGETALYLACRDGHTERARVLLLEGRANHTIADWQGRSPMAMAQREGHHDIVLLLQWYDGELERAFLLSKARAVMDDTQSISKAAEKAQARTEEEAQQARVQAAPAYLAGRVRRGEALPVVEVVGQAGQADQEEEEEEERRTVEEYVVRWLKEDLFIELIWALRFR